jgi:hypothetical protein
VTVLGVAALLAVLVGFTAPWLSERALDRAESLQTDDVVGALSAIRTARSWNPWNAGALELRGLIEERSGAFALAAEDYLDAAELTRSSWLDYFRTARAARAAGDEALHRRACRLAHAANPAERRLYDGIC